MAFDVCPSCDRPLGPPLKSSGRQVCARCGWSDRPRQAKAATADRGESELPMIDILQLLKQAEAESLDNMKPRRVTKPAQPPIPPASE